MTEEKTNTPSHYAPVKPISPLTSENIAVCHSYFYVTELTTIMNGRYDYLLYLAVIVIVVVLRQVYKKKKNQEEGK